MSLEGKNGCWSPSAVFVVKFAFDVDLIGSPVLLYPLKFFTTDSAASLRAIEIEADVILKGTRVDGIYSADPEKEPDAERFSSLSFDEVFRRGLKVMDMTAFTLCNENKLPIIVFDINQAGNLLRIVEGEEVGTIVTV